MVLTVDTSNPLHLGEYDLQVLVTDLSGTLKHTDMKFTVTVKEAQNYAPQWEDRTPVNL